MKRHRAEQGSGQQDLLGEATTLEQRVEGPRFNNAENYGITIESLDPFLRKVNSDGEPLTDIISTIALREIVDVLYNTESLDGRYGTSHDILSRKNSAESLAWYKSLHPIIHTENRKSPQFQRLLESARKDFAKFTSEQTTQVYSRTVAIREMAHRRLGYNGHPTYQGCLVKRMQDVPQEDVERVVKSLTLKHRNPGEKTTELPYHYPNPEEGIKKENNHEIRLYYAWAVVKFFTKLYQANTRISVAGR